MPLYLIDLIYPCPALESSGAKRRGIWLCEWFRDSYMIGRGIVSDWLKIFVLRRPLFDAGRDRIMKKV